VPRVLHFTSGPHDWKALLADPQKHWRTGFSARTLAYCWESSDGLPPEIERVFASATEPLIANFVPLLAVPEFKVPLPGGQRPSQSDIFVLGRSKAGPVSMMVEGKVSESFGPTIDEWHAEASPGKDERLSFLLRTLGLPDGLRGAHRYQLLHRAASAVLEGERYRAVAAVMLVHSFSEKHVGWSDYEDFLQFFGVRAEAEVIQRLPASQVVPLFAAWVLGDCKFLSK
jgi:hypothetical protein